MVAVLTQGDKMTSPRLSRRWRFEPGDQIVPGRRALQLLGGGDRYEAYVAWDERLHIPVVAKMLRRHLVDDARARAAIAAEAEALARLQHPVLVRSFGAVLDGERPHLVLEFLDGPRLSTLIRRFGPLAAEQLIPLARQISSGIGFMAGEGWFHLDVKPSNIVMTSSPRLIDLSVARRHADARNVKRPVGTDAYMAPEQCEPARFSQIGPAADVWGLGVTLFEASPPERPFRPTGSRASRSCASRHRLYQRRLRRHSPRRSGPASRTTPRPGRRRPISTSCSSLSPTGRPGPCAGCANPR